MSGSRVSVWHKELRDQKVKKIPRDKDNTSDIGEAEVRVHNKYAHIRRPDDGSGATTRAGSFNPGSNEAQGRANAKVVPPQTG